MHSLDHLINSTGYPRWLVVLCAGLVAVAAVWFLAKALEWTLLLAFGVMVVLLALGGLFWLFG